MQQSRSGAIGRMAAILLAATAIAPAVLLDTVPARADGGPPIEVDLATAHLMLPVPPGFCVVDRSDPLAIESFAALDAALGGGTLLLAWFVDCRTLDAMRAGAAPAARSFDRYGVYVTPVNDAGTVQTFAGWERTEFVRAIAASLPPFDRSQLSQIVAKDAADETAGAAVRLASREIGLLGADASAYYLATAAELTYDNEHRTLAGVAGSTLVYDLALSVILYSGFEGTGTLATLEQEARAATNALIAANPGGEGSGRGIRIDANRALLIASAIGLLFLAIGIVNSAWKWWCRRHGLQP